MTEFFHEGPPFIIRDRTGWKLCSSAGNRLENIPWPGGVLAPLCPLAEGGGRKARLSLEQAGEGETVLKPQRVGHHRYRVAGSGQQGLGLFQFQLGEILLGAHTIGGAENAGQIVWVDAKLPGYLLNLQWLVIVDV